MVLAIEIVHDAFTVSFCWYCQWTNRSGRTVLEAVARHHQNSPTFPHLWRLKPQVRTHHTLFTYFVKWFAIDRDLISMWIILLGNLVMLLLSAEFGLSVVDHTLHEIQVLGNKFKLPPILLIKAFLVDRGEAYLLVHLEGARQEDKQEWLTQL